MSVPAAPGCLRWRNMESSSVENATAHVLKVDRHEASAVSKLGGDRSAWSNGGPLTEEELSHGLCHQMVCERLANHTGLTWACLYFLTNKTNCVCAITTRKAQQ